MRRFISSGLRRGEALFRTVAGLTALALAISGCNEPVNTYQTAETPISGGEKVLVLPFMDTRTFVDNKDPHKDDLGTHARNIFVSVMKENRIGRESTVLSPDLPAPSLSLTNAQVAEYGRMYGADIVVAGQMFSYTETRAASIPPRAGMFVRVVSARDGTLLFVGDHYQAAAVPGAAGGRDQQARNVSAKLIEGITVTRDIAMGRNINGVASSGALASVAVRSRDPVANDNSPGGNWDAAMDPLPLPPPPVDIPDLAKIDADAWSAQSAPELPPLPAFGDFPIPSPVEKDAGADTESAEPETAVRPPIAEPGPGIVPMAPPMLDELDPPSPEQAFSPPEGGAGEDMAEAESTAGDAIAEEATIADGGAETEPAIDDGESESYLADAGDESGDADETRTGTYDWIGDASDAAKMTGDELAADLFASETPLLEESLNSPAKFTSRRGTETVPARIASPAELDGIAGMFAPSAADSDAPPPIAETSSVPSIEPALSEWRAWESAQDVAALVEAGELEVSRVEEPASPVEETAAPMELAGAEPAGLAAALDDDNGPVISVPIAVEQPRSFRSVDLVQAIPTDDAIVSFSPNEAFGQNAAPRNAIRVLVLPYHERKNSNNLIAATGGGEVVTTLYGSELALDPDIQVMWDGSGQTSHDRLIDREEALQLGRMVNADFVVRGQVVEFRRAQSVPSFYSAVISTAVLAAQIFFAEMSGVDVATEVYRVSDGVCVMSRRDRAQQKYVVQAEKTVRRLANGMADSVIQVVKASDQSIMDPLIDTIEPVTVLNNPWS